MEEHGPWKTLKSKTVHESMWIKVEHHDVINPGGKPGAYTTVHFKNLAIGILALDKDLNTYLVGQYRYPLKSYSWEIPEGGGDRSIDPLETAKRELKEETGIEAKDWRVLLKSHLSNSATDEEAIVFLAQDLDFGDAEPEEDEELEARKVPAQEFIRMVADGEATDAITMMAALKLETMILKGDI